MKKLSTYLLLIFFTFQTPSWADDIRDFQIEGMSIGDSLLDYMTEDEILDAIEINKGRFFYLKEPNKYAEVFLFDYSSIYESTLFSNSFKININDCPINSFTCFCPFPIRVE